MLEPVASRTVGFDVPDAFGAEEGEVACVEGLGVVVRIVVVGQVDEDAVRDVRGLGGSHPLDGQVYAVRPRRAPRLRGPRGTSYVERHLLVVPAELKRLLR